MSTFFSIFNLALHRVAVKDATQAYLGGVFVDPSKGVTMASDGKRLVEITCPAVDKFPTPKGVTLANGESLKPFIIPADIAQRILKSLPKPAKPGDPKSHAALVAPQKGAGGGKVSIVSGDGTTVSFSPIDATFPDVSKADIFPAKEPKVSLMFNPELLGDTAKAAALGRNVKLYVFDDRIVIESDGDEKGLKSRAVLMSLKGEAKYEPPAKADPTDPENTECDPAADPEVEEVEEVDEVEDAPETGDNDPAPGPESESRTTSGSVRSNGGYSQPWSNTRRRDEPSGPPTTTQRAFHTYLIRTRGGTLSPEHLHEADISAQIEDLKAESAADVPIATWRQWKKIFLLLAERKADDAKVCATLNGLKDIGQTSGIIDALLKKAA